MCADPLQDLCLFFFAPDEGGEGSGQVVRGGRRCWCSQLPKARLFSKIQQALHPLWFMLKVQGWHEQGLECCHIWHALTLFETTDLRIAVPDLNSELALREFLAFAQVFEQVAKGGKFFR